MRLLKSFFLILIFVSLSFASTLKEAEDFETAILQGKKENKNVILFIESSSCPWCIKMKETTLKDKEVINYLNENYVFVRINRDLDFCPDRFNPYGVPTTYVIDPKSQEKLFSMRGYKSSKSFLSRLKG